MNSRTYPLILRAFFFSGVCGTLISAAGARADDGIAIADIHGVDVVSKVSTSLTAGKKGEVVIFMSSKCPCSNSHVPVIKDLAKDFPDFQFVVVHANADEDEPTTANYFKSAAFVFPVLQDEASRMANELKAFKTPHSFVLNPDGKILYRGGVTSSASASRQDKQYLRDALEDIQKGQGVRVASGRTLGCAIAR